MDQQRRNPSSRGMSPSVSSGLLLVLLSGIGLVGCGSSTELSSTWRVAGVTVDSGRGDWKSPFTELKDRRVFIGMQNDSNYFYLRILAPNEQFRREVLSPGLTVTFEADGGKKLGILYPVGGFGLQNLEILGPGENDKTLLSTLEAPGINVHVGGYEGTAMYELKVPLKATKEHPYAVGAAAGSTVRIALETGKAQRENTEGERGFSGGEGGGRPMGGGEGYGGGGRRGGGRSGRGGGSPPGSSLLEPLDFKAQVHIALPASAVQAH